MIDEGTTPSGIGPREMVTVCLAWESAFRLASATTERAVLLRMGIGFGGPRDPATAKLARLVRLGLGGKIGSGRQWVSWIALDDIIDAMVLAIDDPTMTGTYHVTSPVPVTNAQNDGDVPSAVTSTVRAAEPGVVDAARRAAARRQCVVGVDRAARGADAVAGAGLQLLLRRLRRGDRPVLAELQRGHVDSVG